jgi:general secretion pathway protein B
MSYILDALRKSEEDRHKSKVPTLGTQNHLIRPAQKKSSLIPVLLVLALLLNGAGLVYWMMTKTPNINTQTAANTKTESSVPVEQSVASPVIQSVSPSIKPAQEAATSALRQSKTQLTPKPKLQPFKPHSFNDQQDVVGREVKSTNEMVDSSSPPQEDTSSKIPQNLNQKTNSKQDTELSASVTPKQNQSQMIVQSDQSASRVKPPVKQPKIVARVLPDVDNKVADPSDVNAISSDNTAISEDKTASEEYRSVPDVSELAQNIQKTLPAFHFNSHIYSSNPSARRVMINNYYLHEGQEFSGVTLETIAPDGVVIKANGVRFHLPALKDWSYK